MRVPFVDLAVQHAQVERAVADGFNRVLASRAFVGGPAVAEFEAAYAAYSDADHCIAVANGTDAIELGLRAAGIGHGDEVIIPANTFVATVEATVRAGALPVVVDCDEDYLLDPVQLEGRITPRTRAIIGVDLYGQVAPIDAIREMVAGSEILVLEDGAQSQGARRHGTRAGGIADITFTSFYPGKNLGAYGDAGAVLTSDAALAEEVRRLRNHGGLRKYEHDVVGMNSRLDTLQAVVLQAKLPLLDEWNEQRRRAAAHYDAALRDTAAVLPVTKSGNEHVFHLYVVRVPDRDGVLAALAEAGVEAGIHYPAPVHLVPAFRDLADGPGSFPVAERLAGEILSLPVYPGITAEIQNYVADALRAALARVHP